LNRDPLRNIRPADLLGHLDKVEVPPLSADFSSMVLSRLVPLVEQNRRDAGLGPLPSSVRAQWQGSRLHSHAQLWIVGMLAVCAAILALIALLGIPAVGSSQRGSLALGAGAALLSAGALLAAHAGQRLGSRTLADVVATWMGRVVLRFPGIPPALVTVLDPLEHGGGAFRAVRTGLELLWAADIELRRHDATLRFGRWLGCAGIGVTIIGLLGVPLRLPWASVQVAFGLATCVVGYYLGTARNLLKEDTERAESACHGAMRHRAMFATSLLMLAGLSVWSSIRFRPVGIGGPSVAMARVGMTLGATLATVACLVACISVTIIYRRLAPRTAAGQAQSNRLRLSLIRVSARAAGAACIVYAAAHIVVAVSIAPTTALKEALLATAGLLCIAARDCFHDPRQYTRPVLFWFEGRLREGALGVAAVEEGVRMRRVLVANDPANRRELAEWLHLLARRLGELGERGSDSLSAVLEAVDIRRELAEADPGLRSDLAASLHLMTVLAWRLGRRDENPLAAVDQAVYIRHELAKTDPAQRIRLADSLYLRTVLRNGRHDPVASGRVLFALSAA
jgi:hypothetical protein